MFNIRLYQHIILHCLLSVGMNMYATWKIVPALSVAVISSVKAVGHIIHAVSLHKEIDQLNQATPNSPLMPSWASHRRMPSAGFSDIPALIPTSTSNTGSTAIPSSHQRTSSTGSIDNPHAALSYHEEAMKSKTSEKSSDINKAILYASLAIVNSVACYFIYTEPTMK